MYTKKNPLQIFDSGILSAAENMALDAKLLSELDPNGLPLLHLYDWKRPSITFGHFIQPKEFLHLDQLEMMGIDLARRPTGGGIVFHLWDLAFSFLMPANHPACSQNTLENYEFVNRAVRKAVAKMGEGMELIPQDAPLMSLDCAKFCMARPTIYDVVLQGRKIAGAAQRRTKLGYLHQGTISLRAPDFDLLKRVLRSEEVLLAMKDFSYVSTQVLTRQEIQQHLRQFLEEEITQNEISSLA